MQERRYDVQKEPLFGVGMFAGGVRAVAVGKMFLLIVIVDMGMPVYVVLGQRADMVAPFSVRKEIDELADPRAERKFYAAHGEDGDELIEPRHIGDEHDEERLVARGDEHGEQRAERDVPALVQLCRHH